MNSYPILSFVIALIYGLKDSKIKRDIEFENFLIEKREFYSREWDNFKDFKILILFKQPIFIKFHEFD